MSTKKMIVKFTKSWRGYNAGEVAGFEPGEAKKLIDGDVAEDAVAKPATGQAAAARGATPRGRRPSQATTNDGEAPDDGDGQGGEAGDTQSTTQHAEHGDAQKASGGSADNDDRP